MNRTIALASPLLEAERLTLAVLFCGVVALALSDFVSPFYWLLVTTAGLLRLWRGPHMALKELHASLIGWTGFAWVGIELALGRAFLVALTDFLLILALAVIVEEATPRNHLHRILVSGFLILAAAVLTDSVLYALPLLAFLLLLWRAAQRLYGLQHAGEALGLASWLTDARVAAAMAAASAVLFVALPRFDFHSALRPTQPRMETSGFSDQVQLGDFGRTLDPTVVLRVEPVHPRDAVRFRHLIQGRYWRGISLGRFTGDGWRRVPASMVAGWQAGDSISRGGTGMEVAVYREATDYGVVMLPDGWHSLEQIPASMLADNQGTLRFDSPPSRRLRLLMTIGRDHTGAADMRPPVAAERDVSMVPPAVARWAREVAGDTGSDAERVGRLVSTLRGWTYDLHVRVDPAQPMQSFLQNKRGYCEMYATLLTLAIRSLGIPARVINGYYGGEWNAVGHFLLIRQMHAHSWVEAWIGGRWQREDGTPPSRWALGGVEFPGIDAIWETIKLSWYRYVLEFESADRGRLMAGIWHWLRIQLPTVAGAATILAILIWGWPRLQQQRHRQRTHKVRAWPLLDFWLKQRGWQRSPSMPLRAVPAPSGIDAGQWQTFVGAWEAQAFGATKPWRRHELRRNLRAISKARW
jgi:protein-glutamine gamma-glutamyltransferase